MKLFAKATCKRKKERVCVSEEKKEKMKKRLALDVNNENKIYFDGGNFIQWCLMQLSRVPVTHMQMDG